MSDGDRAERARDTGVPVARWIPRLEGRSDEPPRLPVDERDPHVVYLTSGSTGRPKGVVVSHRASWLRSWPGGATFTLALRGGGGILTSFPLFHYGGWHYVFEAWHQRRPLHVVKRADAAHLLDAIHRWAPAGVYCIPAVWGRILDTAGDAADGSDLSCVGAADTGTSATPPELLNRLRRRMPQATTSVFYGSTEAGHHTTLADWDVDDHPGSVGRAAPGSDIRIGDDEEICVRAETLMNGYHGMPAPTAAVLRDGWYHTGDAGYLNDDGYLYITGRLREVIRTGGETVGPAEVEAAVRTYPGVRDAAVVGLADERWGELSARSWSWPREWPPLPWTRCGLIWATAWRRTSIRAGSWPRQACPGRRPPGRSSGRCSERGWPSTRLPPAGGDDATAGPRVMMHTASDPTPSWRSHAGRTKSRHRRQPRGQGGVRFRRAGTRRANGPRLGRRLPPALGWRRSAHLSRRRPPARPGHLFPSSGRLPLRCGDDAAVRRPASPRRRPGGDRGRLERRFPGLASHMEQDNPGMHTTDTIDFEYVLSGEIAVARPVRAEVVLHPGDTVVQNGTRHRWHNRSSEPAVYVAFLVGAHRQ